MAKLYFYYSAMNAGKSTHLLQSSHNYRERGMPTLLFTPDFDDRAGRGKIASRIGIDAEAVPFSKEFDFYAYLQQVKTNLPIRCILVDEAHFLTKNQVLQLAEVVDRFGIPVLTYGLRSDFRGETFVGSQYLLALADELVEVKTICHCGRKASMNMRIDAERRAVREGPQVEIAGNDRYVAVCRRHFRDGDPGPEFLLGKGGL